MKKSIALLLALVLCLGVLAGCQEAPAETTTAPTTTAATSGSNDSTTAPTEEPEYSFEGKTLDMWTYHDLNGHDLQKWTKEAIGLDVQFVINNATSMEALLTEKVTPSMLYVGSQQDGHKYGRYGAYINFYDYKDIMPNFFAKYESYGDAIKEAYETAPGELYTAPLFLNGDVEHYGWYYRADIFEELKLEAPTDWESFLGVCKALKEAYPDKYPFTARNLTGGMSFFVEFAQQFGFRYRSGSPVLNRTTGEYINAVSSNEAREMLTMMRELITLGYMDVATLANDTSMWVADISSGKSFITFDKAFQMTNLESAGQEANPEFSLKWWNNIPLTEAGANFNYHCHFTPDYALGRVVTTKCPDIELACRYIDWQCSEEGSLLWSWGKEGESYEVDSEGNKHFIEGYDATFFARYQTGVNIDMKATAATYSPNGQDMIFDTTDASKQGEPNDPNLVFTNEEQKVRDTYQTDFNNTYRAYWQKFMLGELEINDANWDKMIAELDGYGADEILEVYNAAYQRYLAE